MEIIRKGKASTRKTPGIRPSPKPDIALLDAEKNPSSSDFESTPYAINKFKYPERLSNQKAHSEHEKVQGSSEDPYNAA